MTDNDGPRYNVPNPPTRFIELSEKALVEAIDDTSRRSEEQLERALKQYKNNISFPLVEKWKPILSHVEDSVENIPIEYWAIIANKLQEAENMIHKDHTMVEKAVKTVIDIRRNWKNFIDDCSQK